jgi:hypothetical protein
LAGSLSLSASKRTRFAGRSRSITKRIAIYSSRKTEGDFLADRAPVSFLRAFARDVSPAEVCRARRPGLSHKGAILGAVTAANTRENGIVRHGDWLDPSTAGDAASDKSDNPGAGLECLVGAPALVPASPSIEAAAADQKHDDYDDEKSCHIHDGVLL